MPLLCHLLSLLLTLFPTRLLLPLSFNRVPYVWAFVLGRTISAIILLPGDNLVPHCLSPVRSDALGGAHYSFVFALTISHTPLPQPSTPSQQLSCTDTFPPLYPLQVWMLWRAASQLVTLKPKKKSWFLKHNMPVVVEPVWHFSIKNYIIPLLVQQKKITSLWALIYGKHRS